MAKDITLKKKLIKLATPYSSLKNYVKVNNTNLISPDELKKLGINTSKTTVFQSIALVRQMDGNYYIHRK